MIAKAEAVFQMLGFCPSSKNFTVEDISRAAFDTINHTVSLQEGLKVARCYADNKHLFKKFVKVISRHYYEYFGRAAIKTNVRFTDYTNERQIFHVSNALTRSSDIAVAIGRTMQVEATNSFGKYHFRPDSTYYIEKTNYQAEEMGLYKKDGKRVCIVHMTPTKEIILLENETNFIFEDGGETSLIYEKGNKKAPIGMMKWDALTTSTREGLVRIELLDPQVNYEQLLHIAYATLLIFKSVCLASDVMNVLRENF